MERRWRILSTVSVGTFMATLDGSIVNISLPRIREAFGIDLATVGLAILALGLLSLVTLPAGFAPFDLVWRLALVGLGQGLFMSPNSSAVLGSVPRPRLGTASGTLAQMRIDGQALGIAISGAIVAARVPVYLATMSRPTSAAAQEAALALGIRDAFIVAGLLCCVGIVTSAVRGPKARPEPVAAEASAGE